MLKRLSLTVGLAFACDPEQICIPLDHSLLADQVSMIGLVPIVQLIRNRAAVCDSSVVTDKGRLIDLLINSMAKYEQVFTNGSLHPNLISAFKMSPRALTRSERLCGNHRVRNMELLLKLADEHTIPCGPILPSRLDARTGKYGPQFLFNGYDARLQQLLLSGHEQVRREQTSRGKVMEFFQAALDELMHQNDLFMYSNNGAIPKVSTLRELERMKRAEAKKNRAEVKLVRDKRHQARKAGLYKLIERRRRMEGVGEDTAAASLFDESMAHFSRAMTEFDAGSNRYFQDVRWLFDCLGKLDKGSDHLHACMSLFNRAMLHYDQSMNKFDVEINKFDEACKQFTPNMQHFYENMRQLHGATTQLDKAMTKDKHILIRKLKHHSIGISSGYRSKNLKIVANQGNVELFDRRKLVLTN